MTSLYRSRLSSEAIKSRHELHEFSRISMCMPLRMPARPSLRVTRRSEKSEREFISKKMGQKDRSCLSANYANCANETSDKKWRQKDKAGQNRGCEEAAHTVGPGGACHCG